MNNLDDKTVVLLDQVAGVIVPGFRTLDPEQVAMFRSIVDAALADRPKSLRRQLAIFLRLLDLAPMIRWGRRLGALRPDRAERVLRWFQEVRIGRIRKGFWGLRTLVFMGYPGRPTAWSEIGYGPEFDGRAALDA